MITRFFSTSKPIHLVIISIALLGLFIISRFSNYADGFSLLLLAKELLMFSAALFSVMILAFFVTKNKLTSRNSYKILLFFLFLAIFPETLRQDNILLSNFFVLLAFRRIFSLNSNLRAKIKLFDAGLWISLASLFYFGSILFFAIIFAAIMLFSISSVKNWIVPVLGMLCVLVILVCYNIVVNDSYGNLAGLVQSLSFDYSAYNRMDFIVGTTIFISFSVWATFFYVQSFSEKLKASKASHNLVLFATIIALVIISISSEKSGSEFIFLFAPIAIVMSNYLEGVSEKWFGEIFVWLLIITPIARLVL